MAMSLSGCAGRQQVHPEFAMEGIESSAVASGPDDAAVLALLTNLSPRERHMLQGGAVIAEPSYFAASGRPCRTLRLRQAGAERSRLACLDNATWRFMPDVFVDPSAESGP